MRVRLWVCEKEHMWVQVDTKIYTHHEKDSVFFFYLEMILGVCVFTCCACMCASVALVFVCVCMCAHAGTHVWCVHMCV